MPSTVKKSLREAVLTIKDGTGTPKTVIVKIGTGNLTWTVNTPMEYETDRGSIATGQVRAADDVPVDVNLTCRFIDVFSESGELITPYEAVYGIGAAATASWISTGADNCEPFAVEFEIIFTPDCSGGTPKVNERVVFNEFRAESCAFDPDAGTLVITGKSKEVHPTVNRDV